ncbi:hypothetical protein NDU88_000374 [Pleurodeles waltl]|uniref:Uncharacterized protein n=1 Tax=Pleurodeles waltl TaxID=8319 RepID=A0AAV7NB64_PLEWA|nr:hypothetical protein NDU88_000374 [Pleurodeles waltl]
MHTATALPPWHKLTQLPRERNPLLTGPASSVQGRLAEPHVRKAPSASAPGTRPPAMCDPGQLGGRTDCV